MSAEKEIINFWYNKNGFFTISNIKTASNKDAGILALRQNSDGINEICHVGIMCSITSNIAEAANLGNSIGRIIYEKFDDNSILDAIFSHLGQFNVPRTSARVIRKIVLGLLPKSQRSGIIHEFGKKGVEVIKFEDVLYDIFAGVDSQYYKNDVIRTIQLTKFLLLSEPEKLARLLANDSYAPSSRKEFLTSILDKQEIIREFKSTNAQRLGAILKNSGLKPAELADMLENTILNKKTRKVFFTSLMNQEKMRKIVNESRRIKKINMPLKKFIV